MGKPTGFLEYERQENEAIQPLSRITNFNEFHPFLDEETRRKQGARCMNCGVPFCQSAIKLKNMVTGCPLHNLIPEWNDEIYNGNDKRALSRLLKTNPFPEFTGRVCPALCEKACLNGLDQEPVTIKENELYTIETAYTNNWMTPYVPSVRSDKKVAIIGSGPAGLALAHDLNRRGHSVTVFEKEDRIGGLLMYGIPNMKLDDAIVFATGSKKARDLNVKNRDCTGIYFAVDYLTKATKHLLDNTEEISAKYKHVVIVGGGDTGNDCVGTSIRQGCASVVQIEMMPKTPDERLQSNPWPEWPKICKTDYGQEEAIAVFKKDPRIYETTVKECILDEKKNLKQIKTVKVHFNNGKLEEVKGSEQILDCDLLLIAAGFIGVEDDLKKSFKLETTQRNTIVTQPNSYQVKDKYFTAGDCHRGQSLVVWAIHEGKECAKEVDTYLMGYTNME